MPTPSDRKILAGSEPAQLTGARALGPVPRDERFEVTVRLRRKAPLRAAGFEADQAPAQRQYLTREQYATDFGADPADMAAVEAFARGFGLVVVDSDAARRSVFLSGSARQFEAAFGTTISQVEHEDGVSRRRSGAMTLPAGLADRIEGVFGTQDTPIARPHFQARMVMPDGISHADASVAFTPSELARLYNFPTGVNGAGQCVALIELGGGYRSADLEAYFRDLRLPVPNVKSISVDGGKNHPTKAASADGEVMLDIEVVAAVAPKAAIVVYFAPNTSKGFLDAITMALHDTVNRPSVISISWGNPEKRWSAQDMHSFDQAFQSAAAMGVTICCAAGDNGSGDEDPDRAPPDGLAHADFPGSSPYALCCGGTRLTASAGVIVNETVWNDDPRRSATGGGVSDFFAPPAYQGAAGVPPSANPGARVGRGVPDVAGDADPATGYRVRIDGHDFIIGGTSAVAPLWAGLVALMNQKLGVPVGFLNPLLYGMGGASGAFHDIISGDNGAYQAQPGWDPCTGWGSPDGVNLLRAIENRPAPANPA